MATAQSDGALDQTFSPEVISRFSLMLLFGSLLAASLDLPTLDRGEWQRLIARLASVLQPESQPEPITAEPGAPS